MASDSTICVASCLVDCIMVTLLSGNSTPAFVALSALSWPRRPTCAGIHNKPKLICLDFSESITRDSYDARDRLVAWFITISGY